MVDEVKTEEVKPPEPTPPIETVPTPPVATPTSPKTSLYIGAGAIVSTLALVGYLVFKGPTVTPPLPSPVVAVTDTSSVTLSFSKPVTQNSVAEPKEVEGKLEVVSFDRQTSCDVACIRLKIGYKGGDWVDNSFCHCRVR